MIKTTRRKFTPGFKAKVALTIMLSCMLSMMFAQSWMERPVVWLRADSSELEASLWRDVSGNGNHAMPTAEHLSAQYGAMNFNKCFALPDSASFRINLDSLQRREARAIIVYETDDSSPERGLWSLRLDSSHRVGLSTQRIFNDNGQIRYDTLNRQGAVVNYLTQVWKENSVGAAPYTLSVGATNELPCTLKMSEFLYFDKILEDTTITQWISYIAIKYGITLYQTDYLDSRRNMIWNSSDYPDYCTSIAGVGRDDTLRLYQKQTYYADGQMVFGLGTPAIDNEQNAAVLSNGDFIIMGMDSVLSAVAELYTQSGETYEVIGRSMVQVTGEAYTHSTFLLIDTAAVRDNNAPILIIDRSGTGEFPYNETEQIACAGVDTNGCLIYNNIHWDTDQNGRDFFCFAVRLLDTVGTPKSLVADNAHGTGLTNGVLQDRAAGDKVSLENASSHIPQYSLQPNPNHGNFTVEMTYPKAQDVAVAIYDSEGRLLHTMSGRGEYSYHFEGTVKSAGHYYIEITSPMERKTLKMVVN